MAFGYCLAMVLIDFYGLAVLHKLSRNDATILSKPSHPPPMPDTKPSPFRLPLVPPVRLHHTAQPAATMPQRNRGVTPPVPCSTPTPAAGTSILQKLRADTDEPTKYDCDKWEQYIAQDFERHRVFIDISVFMEQVLRVPKGWEDDWKQTIDEIKMSEEFSVPYLVYTKLCDTPGGQEEAFYKPLVDMTNAILTVWEKSSGDAVHPTRQRYLRNDPHNIRCGMMNDLSPDIVAVHGESVTRVQERKLQGWNMTWAQPLQMLEVKPSDSALVDGACMPRLKVDGESVDTSSRVL